MGSFQDLQKASEEASYQQGLKDGLTLTRDRALFLEKTFVYQMKYKKKRDEYDQLFNKPNV